MLTPELTRAGRALLDWSQTDLATHAHLTLSTIRDFESGKRPLLHNNLAGIQLALENAGIVFDTGFGEGVAVRRVPVGTNRAVTVDPSWPAGVRRV